MSPDSADPGTPIDLANCDREPIHIPGTIQPHGLLLAFDAQRRVGHASTNAASLLQLPVVLGASIDALGLAARVDDHRLLCEAFESAHDGSLAPLSIETELQGAAADLVVHAHHGLVVAEWELRRQSSDEVASFALKAHRMIDRLRRLRTVETLLADAVEQMRALTGFDRVMAYRFRHDDSGEVLAEACDAALEPFLGRRYPASDIPAQARRLYVLNTLRLIADVGYAPVAVHSRSPEPLDMSHCVLRSVSPIHIEYLQNIGVGASMSVSIVINGRLWGLIACHHRGPRHVPYSVRMACDVLAQVLASSVAGLIAADESAQVSRAASIRTRTMESVFHGDDVVAALHAHESELRASLQADALLFVEHGKMAASPGFDEGIAAAIVRTLASEPDGGLQLRSARAQWPASLREAIGPWVGLLALPFDQAGNGWIVALRREQVQQIRWGGRPEKEYTVGPNGPRLTPRGSMDEWREEVRDTAEPWSSVVLEIARELLAEMRRAVNSRLAESDRLRTQLMAMLGHDLRDPLASIHMAASLMSRGVGADQLGQRISRASGRMQRLIDHVMDLSRISGGIGIGLQRRDTDLARLLQELIADASQAHPGVAYALDAPDALEAQIDADRIAQVLGNLLSNARHHGTVGEPIAVSLARDGANVVFEVRNVGAAIDPALADTLFRPFKPATSGSPRARSGLGLGLFIAQQIVAAHAGRIDYRYDSPRVVFRVELPRHAPAAG